MLLTNGELATCAMVRTQTFLFSRLSPAAEIEQSCKSGSVIQRSGRLSATSRLGFAKYAL